MAESQETPGSALAALGIDAHRWHTLMALARDEDLGRRGDITSGLIELPAQCSATLRARQSGIIAGLALVPDIVALFDGDVVFDALVADGDRVAGGATLGRLRGPAAALWTAERTLLNVLQRLCGVATHTRRFVDAVAGTAAQVFDTRKTLPGWRDLDKYAVRCGGGHNHRHGLHDAVLIKDNHLAGVAPQRLAGHLFDLLSAAAALQPPPTFVEVEIDTLDQLHEVFKVVGIDIVLLDNFAAGDLRAAVALRDGLNLRGKVALEASGGIDLATVAAVAACGVDRIAIGALTHSAVALDIGLDVD